MDEELNDRERQSADAGSEVIKRIEEARRSGTTELNLSGNQLTRLPESIGESQWANDRASGSGIARKAARQGRSGQTASRKILTNPSMALGVSFNLNLRTL
jgi:hypothetical protein